MDWNNRILLWERVSVAVVDVRRARLDRGERLTYRLPASAYLYGMAGTAQTRVGGEATTAGRFTVLHAGKGAVLDVTAEDTFDYVLILYKAQLPLPARREWMALFERDNPFRLYYRLEPRQPLALQDIIEKMERLWTSSGALDRLGAKTLFYQFVCSVLEELADVRPEPRPGPVEQAVHYIERHYREPITLDSLAGRLGCHSRQLLRLFKVNLNTSPIDYLIQVRMRSAGDRLLHTDLPLKEVAESVGYADSYYFSRQFKKTTGISPSEYRQLNNAPEFRRNNPSRLSGFPIAGRQGQRYIDYDNHYQYSSGGDLPMHHVNKKTLAIALFVCFSLLLGACSTGANAPTNAGNTGSTASQTAAPTASPATAADTETPRVIKHAMGEETLTGTPERVVILTNEGTEALLTLGIKPVGAVQSWSGDPWYDHIKDDMQEVTDVGDELQPNVELIASLKPDLIIGTKVRQEKIYEQLKQIAPTVFSETLAGDWKTNFRLYAEALNKQEEGQQAMDAFDKRVAEAKEKLGSKTETKVSIARFSASQVRIYQKETFSGVLLNQLGFARPASQDVDNFMEVMSKETIDQMDGDVLFYFVTEATGSNEASLVVQEWLNDPLFQNLNVAKTGKVVEVNETIWNTAGGYEAANLLLDEIVAYFEAE